MAREVITKTLELVRTLSVDELREVQQVVQERLQQVDEAAAREAFHRALLASGLVKEIKTAPLRSDQERPLVSIQGKPLSETIVEERR
jgi:hypothetical protein